VKSTRVLLTEGGFEVIARCASADELHRELAVALPVADSAEGAGYLLKDPHQRCAGVPVCCAPRAPSGSAIDPMVVSTLLSKRRVNDPLARLTPREREVLELMASGHSSQGIADRLVITLRAVEKYVFTIFDKLGIPSTGGQSRRVLAVRLYLRS
jgi:DNA-binding NarL/FixJ family response regulator